MTSESRPTHKSFPVHPPGHQHQVSTPQQYGNFTVDPDHLTTSMGSLSVSNRNLPAAPTSTQGYLSTPAPPQGFVGRVDKEVNHGEQPMSHTGNFNQNPVHGYPAQRDMYSPYQNQYYRDTSDGVTQTGKSSQQPHSSIPHTLHQQQSFTPPSSVAITHPTSPTTLHTNQAPGQDRTHYSAYVSQPHPDVRSPSTAQSGSAFHKAPSSTCSLNPTQPQTQMQSQVPAQAHNASQSQRAAVAPTRPNQMHQGYPAPQSIQPNGSTPNHALPPHQQSTAIPPAQSHAAPQFPYSQYNPNNSLKAQPSYALQPAQNQTQAAQQQQPITRDQQFQVQQNYPSQPYPQALAYPPQQPYNPIHSPHHTVQQSYNTSQRPYNPQPLPSQQQGTQFASHQQQPPLPYSYPHPPTASVPGINPHQHPTQYPYPVATSQTNIQNTTAPSSSNVTQKINGALSSAPVASASKMLGKGYKSTTKFLTSKKGMKYAAGGAGVLLAGLIGADALDLGDSDVGGSSDAFGDSGSGGGGYDAGGYGDSGVGGGYGGPGDALQHDQQLTALNDMQCQSTVQGGISFSQAAGNVYT